MMQRFGEVMRQQRIALRKTLADVSSELGFTAVHLSDIERGERNPPAEAIVRRWARYLNLNEEDLTARAQTDVESVRIQVGHDPQKGQLATMFARQLDRMSNERKEALRKLLEEETHR